MQIGREEKIKWLLKHKNLWKTIPGRWQDMDIHDRVILEGMVVLMQEEEIYSSSSTIVSNVHGLFTNIQKARKEL